MILGEERREDGFENHLGEKKLLISWKMGGEEDGGRRKMTLGVSA